MTGSLSQSKCDRVCQKGTEAGVEGGLCHLLDILFSLLAQARQQDLLFSYLLSA